MPFRFNPIVGNFDQIEGPEFPVVTGNIPEGQEDGYFAVAKVDTDGRVYWFSEGQRYSATGTLAP